MVGTLYMVAAVVEPTVNEQNDGKIGEVVIAPTPLIAENAEVAKTVLSRMIPQSFVGDLNRMKLMVQPFCKC